MNIKSTMGSQIANTQPLSAIKEEKTLGEKIDRLPAPAKLALGIFTAPLWLLLGTTSSTAKSDTLTTQQKMLALKEYYDSLPKEYPNAKTLADVGFNISAENKIIEINTPLNSVEDIAAIIKETNAAISVEPKNLPPEIQLSIPSQGFAEIISFSDRIVFCPYINVVEHEFSYINQMNKQNIEIKTGAFVLADYLDKLLFGGQRLTFIEFENDPIIMVKIIHESAHQYYKYCCALPDNHPQKLNDIYKYQNFLNERQAYILQLVYLQELTEVFEEYVVNENFMNETHTHIQSFNKAYDLPYNNYDYFPFGRNFETPLGIKVIDKLYAIERLGKN